MIPLIALERVSFDYHGQRVLDALDFQLQAGERVALIGANGAGKTTLLHLLVGLKRPSAGRIIAFGQVRNCEADFYSVRARVGLLFQDADDQLFCPTVLEDVAFGLLNLGRTPRQARAEALATLASLGLGEFAERVTYRLSAGEKRLVALATVLAMRPEILLLDEPTNGLDDATATRLTAYLAELQQTMLLVSHDGAFLAQLATRTVRLVNGRI